MYINGWFPAVYMSCICQNFRLFHVSNVSVQNFRICLLMYTGSVCQYGAEMGHTLRAQSSGMQNELCSDSVRARRRHERLEDVIKFWPVVVATSCGENQQVHCQLSGCICARADLADCFGGDQMTFERAEWGGRLLTFILGKKKLLKFQIMKIKQRSGRSACVGRAAKSSIVKADEKKQGHSPPPPPPKKT